MLKIDLAERIKGCMLGGAAGDALGAPVEHYDDETIFRHFGENGITEFLLCGDTACITDDTQMTMFTADGLLRAEEKYENPTEEDYIRCVYERYLNWLSTQDSNYALDAAVERSPLLDCKELHARRAPGATCLSALRSGKCGSFETKLNRSKGCGGVMRIAPVALLFAQRRDRSCRFVGETAARIAAITHNHPLAYIPAAFLAILLRDILLGNDDYERAVQNALLDTEKLFSEEDDIAYFSTLIQRAVALANDRNIEDDLDAIRELGQGWVAEETVAIAVYCALRHRDSFADAVIAAVNHSGDSDSTGAVTGNLIGAMVGYGNIPEKFIGALELKDELLALSDRLLSKRADSGEVRIIGYENAMRGSVQDLLVELQSHLAVLDKRGVIVMKDNYRDGYFGYVMNEVQTHNGRIFVAVQNERAVGVVVCKIFQGDKEAEFTTSCPKIGFISDMVVTESLRGRGIGKALLRHAEEYFRNSRCEYVQLEVFAPNVNAIKMYETAGFETNCLFLSKKLK